MAKPKSSKSRGTEEKKLEQMLKSKQDQLELLEEKWKLFLDRSKLQDDKWVSDVNAYQERISQMKKDMTTQEMEHAVEIAQANFVIGLKRRDAYYFRKKFEDAKSELADFRELFDLVSRKCSESRDVPRASTHEKAEMNHKAQEEDELRRLRNENERLTSEENSKISALQEEKNFIWNQFDKLNEQLTKDHNELTHATEKIEALQREIAELKSSHTDKDNTIAMLRTQIVKLESDKTEEISKLYKEIELLKKSGSSSVTPVARRSSARSGPSKLRGTSRGTDREKIALQSIEKGQTSNKRKAGESKPVVPKLFTSAFTVPKVKAPSPCVT